MQNPLSKILPAHQLRQPHPYKDRFQELGILQADLAEILQRLEQGGFVPRRIEPLPPVDFKNKFQALGFSQAKLARSISRSESEISKWLNKKKPIPREAHLAMLEILQQMEGGQ